MAIEATITNATEATHVVGGVTFAPGPTVLTGPQLTDLLELGVFDEARRVALGLTVTLATVPDEEE